MLYKTIILILYILNGAKEKVKSVFSTNLQHRKYAKHPNALKDSFKMTEKEAYGSSKTDFFKKAEKAPILS